jgi:hypothetical protein
MWNYKITIKTDQEPHGSKTFCVGCRSETGGFFFSGSK